ncbi:MAG: effector binding domain-containing protein [Defluviitaleaceae bacterium]|nr:effector binding domain-containing protein [Defluviitaleaceae bacterium]MCL2835218.1 effector binding domain-containing protein [Defluviitaleaceae bacterium]
MELLTVSRISKDYGVSTRMLRYYEQNGLIKSLRKEGYSYRVYDEAAVMRLQQVIILRKLQIPVKQICAILNNPGASAVIEVFKKNIREIDIEITALSTIRKILNRFVNELEEAASLNLSLDFLNGDSVKELTGSLSLIQKNIKESMAMNDLNQAAEVLSKLRNVRVIYLPAMTVASYRYIGENHEENALKTVDEFVRKSGLLQIKPDLRHFGFEHHLLFSEHRGYDAMVSIPDDMDVPAPLVKKKLRGGMYAAYTTDIGAVDSWLGMLAWINDSGKYQFCDTYARIEPAVEEIIYTGRFYFEEQLNYYNNIQAPDFNPDDMQWDMLMAIKPAETTAEVSEDITDSLEKCGLNARLVNRNKTKIIGFSKIIPRGSKDDFVEEFTNEIKSDGRLDILNQYRKPGAPLLGFGFHDLDSKRNGGWRLTYGMLESDITDADAFMKHNPFVKNIDASKWLRIEYTKEFDSDSIAKKAYEAAPKLGYIFNSTIMGNIDEYPDGNIGKPAGGDGRESVLYHWFPVL